MYTVRYKHAKQSIPIIVSSRDGVYHLLPSELEDLHDILLTLNRTYARVVRECVLGETQTGSKTDAARSSQANARSIFAFTDNSSLSGRIGKILFFFRLELSVF